MNIVEERKNSINNEYRRLINYFQKFKIFEKIEKLEKLKKIEKKLKKSEYEYESESDDEESDYEESEEIKKFNEEVMKKNNINDTESKYDSNGFDINGLHKDTKTKYDSNDFNINGLHKDTKTKYDSNGFDKDGKNKDTGIFLNKKNINWLKDDDEFLKLYNEIIKNGEFSKRLAKKILFHHMILKNFWKVY